jgi:hypothetical protein
MAASIWKLGTSNALNTTLDGTITSGATTIDLTSASGMQYPGLIVIDRVDANGDETPIKREYISYTNVSGNTLTGCIRGLGGSTAQSHTSGAKVEEVWTMTHWNDFVDAFLVEHGTDGIQKKTLTTVTDTGAPINFNLEDSNVQTVTLVGTGRTVTVTNESVGQVFVLIVNQDATGSRTITTWFSGSTLRWADGGTAPTLTTTASKADVFGFICIATGTFLGFVVGQNA